MKDIKNYTKWMAAAHELLTFTEFKVFSQWYSDAPNFSAGATIIGERLPGLDLSNIRTAIRNLEKKGFLKDSGFKKRNEKGKATKLYLLGDINKVINGCLETRLKQVNSCSKCVDLATKQVDLYPITGRCEVHNRCLDTHVLLEQVEVVSTIKQKTTDSFPNAQTPLGSAKEEKAEQINQSLANDNSDIIEKLEYIIENDRRPNKNINFPPNYKQAENLLAKIKNGSKLTSGQIENIEQMYEFCPTREVKENEDPRLFIDNPIDRSIFEGLPPVVSHDDVEFLKMMAEIRGDSEAV